MLVTWKGWHLKNPNPNETKQKQINALGNKKKLRRASFIDIKVMGPLSSVVVVQEKRSLEIQKMPWEGEVKTRTSADRKQ